MADDFTRPGALLRTGMGLCGAHHSSAGAVLGGLTTRRGFPSAENESAEEGRASLRTQLAHVLGLPPERFAWCRQVHGSKVFTVTRPGLQGEGDALVTDDPSLGLLISVADCIPVLLWEVNGRRRGAAHAGWRGLLAGVLPATVSALSRMGASPGELRAWIGPSISLEHFEVGEDVAARFPSPYVHRRGEWARPHVDLKTMARDQLLEAGLQPAHVQICPDCTYQRRELYYSYRRDRGIRGRHLAYLTVRPGRIR